MTTLNQIAEVIKQAIADEWIKQGHDLTGAAIEKMTHIIEEQPDGAVIYVYDGTKQGYMKTLDQGVHADNIPFTPGQKRADKSEYIKGLIRYGKLRKRLDDKEAVSFAFAVATKHSIEGMPTRDSAQYSQTGKRIDFVADGTESMNEKVKPLVDQFFKEQLQFETV